MTVLWPPHQARSGPGGEPSAWEQRRQDRPVGLELGRESLSPQLLGRGFAEPRAAWVKKGDSALLLRLPGARFTQNLGPLARSLGVTCPRAPRGARQVEPTSRPRRLGRTPSSRGWSSADALRRGLDARQLRAPGPDDGDRTARPALRRRRGLLLARTLPLTSPKTRAYVRARWAC